MTRNRVETIPQSLVRTLGAFPPLARRLASNYHAAKSLRTRWRQKPRVLYVVKAYPQLSQTYISAEVRAVSSEYDVQICAFKHAPHPDTEGLPYHKVSCVDDVVELCRQLRPDILHSHWMTMGPVVGEVAARTRVPFTLRSHSFDSIYFDGVPPHITKSMPYVQSDLCLAVLGFPFVRSMLTAAGLPEHKFVATPPVYDFWRFYDRRNNGAEVMNTGAALAKKAMPEFVHLASKVRDRNFVLYPMGFLTPELESLNRELDSPLTIHPLRTNLEMRKAYKACQWLVYTASRTHRTVGWPLSVREAQASGVGVCLPSIRNDISSYLEGTGFLYDSVEELVHLLRGDNPKAKRDAGFDIAQRDGIHRAKKLLTQYWN